MFGPCRGEWDGTWRGWWGEQPPITRRCSYSPTIRASRCRCRGGTTFTFVTDGIQSALAQARAAAGNRGVAIAGGASTVNQYLTAGLIHELRLHIAPLTLGAGECLFDGSPTSTLTRSRPDEPTS